ncbi:MAG: PepSY domain-containing protein [Actinobacteria bacterium]|nr:PepSY domain-containing protein [Actinomycetota bacterium]MCL5887062.1 PepSY domain-containing protein [Actinomycetota bacterium]
MRAHIGGQATLSMTDAADKALWAVGRGNVYGVAFSKDRGRAVWCVDIRKDQWSGAMCQVDVVSGQVYVRDTSCVPSVVFERMSRMSLEDAIELASEVQSGVLEEARLEINWGQMVWEVYFVDEEDTSRVVYVDADSGAIVEPMYY